MACCGSARAPCSASPNAACRPVSFGPCLASRSSPHPLHGSMTLSTSARFSPFGQHRQGTGRSPRSGVTGSSKRKALDMSPKAVRERWKQEQKKNKVLSSLGAN